MQKRFLRPHQLISMQLYDIEHKTKPMIKTYVVCERFIKPTTNMTDKILTVYSALLTIIGNIGKGYGYIEIKEVDDNDS